MYCTSVILNGGTLERFGNLIKTRVLTGEPYATRSKNPKTYKKRGRCRLKRKQNRRQNMRRTRERGPMGLILGYITRKIKT